MDKTPIYPGAIPLDTNWLQPQRNTEIALGFLMQAAFGTTTIIDGLAVVPTGPATMAVKVGAGSIIVSTTVDTVVSGFGSLAVDNATPLVKIGINTSETTMSALTAPGIAGQSQNWLLEARFIEADGTAVALPYYNASNPAVPYTGPANTGATNNTARTNKVQFQWVGGTAATTGTQSTPTPDAGWTGVAIVTVANGQSTIIAGNITPYSLAPFVPTKLARLRTQLNGNLNIYVATTGSDTVNSGLSAASPFLTLQKAWDYIVKSLDLNGYAVTVNIANGTYTSPLSASGQPVGAISGAAVTFSGNVGSPSNVVISTNGTAITASLGASIALQGMKITTAGSGSCIQSTAQSYIGILGNMEFGACVAAHMWASQSSTIAIHSGYTISGSAANHAVASGCSELLALPGLTFTLTGTPAFSQSFAQSWACSIVQFPSDTFTGAATGVRYSVYQNAVINTSGGGASYIPGNSAGSAYGGGQYV